MGDKSAIEWTEATWNPVTGCSKVSPGCAHCYAEAISLRFGRSAGPWTPANAAENVVMHLDRLDQPFRWRKPRRVFVNSMSDLFHEQVPDSFIAHVFKVMAANPRHTFQILTKRPERMQALLTRWDEQHQWRIFASATADRRNGIARQDYTEDVLAKQAARGESGPLPNLWLGVSIENRRFIHRADLLRDTPAAVRFISAEPLLGPLTPRSDDGLPYWGDHWEGAGLDLTGIDWLIVGGESGPGHRSMRAEWVRDLRDATQRDHNDVVGLGRPHQQFPRWALNGTAFFFKQWGGRTPKAGGRLLDGRTWDEMPTSSASPSPVSQPQPTTTPATPQCPHPYHAPTPSQER